MAIESIFGFVIGFIAGANFVIIFQAIIKKIDEHNEMYAKMKNIRRF
jgi:uncharacterized membrane protein YjfL (UPF0719 family)